MVMERVVSVIKPAVRRPAEAIDIALLVGSSSKQEIGTWDRSKIGDLYERQGPHGLDRGVPRVVIGAGLRMPRSGPLT
jgi:hypothetical protein